MSKGRTIWERLTGKNLPVPVEKRYPNPLGLRIGAHARVDTIDHKDELYVLSEIIVHERTVGGRETTNLVDYFLESDDKAVTIRVVEGKDVKDHKFLLLRNDDYIAWSDESPGILASFDDPSGELYRYRDTPDEEHYWRVNDVKVPYVGEEVTIQDFNRNGIITDDEVEREMETIWDFYRETTDDAGLKVVEYYYAHFSGHYDTNTKEVDVDGGYGSITLERGIEVDPSRITFYDKT